MISSEQQATCTPAVSYLVVGDVLRVKCPHCQAEHEDTWEAAFADGVVETTTCPSCKKTFDVVVAECMADAEESVFIWPRAPIGFRIESMSCLKCGARLGERPEDDDAPC